jgi:hypothetical protein
VARELFILGGNMKIVACSLLLLILTTASVSAAYGQKLLSAKGYFCGQSEPSYVNVHLKVGNSIKVFSTSPDGGIKKKGFSKPFFELPIGTELIIKYKVEKSYGTRGNWIYEAIATGKRNRSVSRCVDE